MPYTDALIGGARAALGQGLGMGWGDEAEAWLRSKLGQGEYEDLLKRVRSEYGEYAQRYPISSGVAEFGGGMVPGVAAMFVPGMQPAGAAQLGATTGSALSRLAARPVTKAALAGGTTGAVTGAGSAVEGERAGGAAVGGTLGAGLGVVAPPAVRAAGAGRSWLMDRLFPSAAKAEERAAEKMTRAMAENGIQPRDIEQRLLQDRALGVPSVVANVDPALSDLAEAVAQRTGRGTRQVEATLERQQAGARERAYQQVRSRLQPWQYYYEEQRLLQDLRTKSEPAYRQAYAVGEVDDPQIQQLLELPQFKGVWNTARSIAEADAAAAQAKAIRGGQSFNPDDYKLRDVYDFTRDAQGNITGIEVTGQVPDVRTLDYMKRALDAQITAGYKSDSAAAIASARSMKDLRDALRDRTKEVVPEYADALRVYKGDKEILDALQSGYNDFGKLDHEEVIKLVGGMSPAEKEAYRTGVVRNLYGRMFGSSRNINAAALLESPETKAKLQPLFDTPAQFNLFQSAVQRESQLFKEANKVLRGSQTGKRLAMKEALEEGDSLTQTAAQAVTGGWTSSLTGLASRALYKSTMTDEMADRLATMLMSKDPADVATVVRVLENYAQQAAPRAAGATRRELGATTGAAVSVMPSPAPDLPPADIREDFAGLCFEHGQDPQELLDKLAGYLSASMLGEFMDDLAMGRV